MPPLHTTEQSHWFTTELQPHEPMLRAWLSHRFNTATDIDDIVQEAYLRVIQARDTARLRSPKAFLFATARNLALDQLRHTWTKKRDDLTENEFGNVLDHSANTPETASRNQELELLTQAIQSLPERCRQIITLRKIYGLSQKEIAAQLNISENTVEAQGTIGLRKLSQFFSDHERFGPASE